MKKIILFLFLFPSSPLFPQQKLDGFSDLAAWKAIASDEVEIKTLLADGVSGKCIRIDFHFKSGTGYCGIRRELPMKLPANFRFSYYIRADAPVNNLEFKLVDKSGDNVWWFNQRSYDFPKQWKREIVKKRNIQFAWGPTPDQTLKEMDKLEIFIASVNGGKGTLYIDELSFEEMEALTKEKPLPVISSSSNTKENGCLLDSNPSTLWHSSGKGKQEIEIDLGKNREYGGLIIDWDEKNYAPEYDVLTSSDKKNWDTAYSVFKGNGGRRYINLYGSESRYIKLDLKKYAGNNYSVKDIYVKEYEFSENNEKYFSEIARDFPRGFFPRYLYNEQSFWIVTGVNNDTKEALLNHDGMAEVDARHFSIEPFVVSGGGLLTWDNSERRHSLAEGYLPFPSVIRSSGGLNIETRALAAGRTGSSVLYLNYKISNRGNADQKGNLYLAVRPFQVNPPWQFLNNPGGIAKINSLKYDGTKITVNDNKVILPLSRPDAFGASEFDSGEIIEFISKDKLPSDSVVADKTGLASCALKYAFDLKPGEEKEYFLAVPFYAGDSDLQMLEGSDPVSAARSEMESTLDFWKKKLNTVQFKLPESGRKLTDIIRSNLAYILINRDKAGIQPGSRSYERSWIRDGSLTSSALLKLGIVPEVKDFVNWYSSYQYSNGKVPCVVDHRGPDPVPENDSHGQLIFAIMQYFNFTKDTLFLRERFPNVVKAVDYMEFLINQRKTDQYKNGNDSLQALYGLLPESISHEGYSAKPMHSYWDDFFGLLGFKSAVQIAGLLNEKGQKERFIRLRDEFRTNLYSSISKSIKNHNINYIPGAAELGDFDATSTTIALYPCGERKNLPEPYLTNTFSRYYEHFQNRLKPAYSWTNYTPYEVRVIGSFLFLEMPEKAHELIRYFIDDQFPSAWNAWAEVVWKDTSHAGFIGDIPHTWVGSDFINAARAMFVYEDDYEKALVIGSGWYEEWLDSPEGIEVHGLPTYYGNISYSVKKENDKYAVNITGDFKMPEGGIEVRNIDKEKLILKVNGRQD